MKIRIKEKFADDYITREAGEKLRELLVDSIRKGKRIVLDFSGLMVASTSFFDEGIAKLALEGFTGDEVKEHLSIQNIHPRDQELLSALCAKRGMELKLP